MSALASLIVLSSIALAGAPTHNSAQSWESTLDKVVPSVVALKVTGTRDFDTEKGRASGGTGFVIDVEQGLILTNRHMVHAGPVLAEAMLLNHEEIELWPVYRDPVHDFGVYRFDPSDVEYMSLQPLTLNPDAARVGQEIRVIGNDSGEKISILDGTLARLDRSAPVYGSNTYNDFNTFYYQAASNTSGGSSGSPVVNRDGDVVALNAGGATRAASSFYLPLHRVTRALEYIRRGETPPRGTLQAVFHYTAFDELVRLGLSKDAEAELRQGAPDGTGALAVREVVPLGPAFEQLEPGDVILRLNGELLHDFYQLEEVLDDGVGQKITLDLERGGAPMTVELKVGDLHAITPERFVEFGRGVFNTTSYMQARNNAVPVRGVYVAQPGYVFGNGGVPKTAIIRSLDGEAVPDLETFTRVLAAKPDGQRVRVRYFTVGDPYHDRETVVLIDRTWYPMRTCVRDDALGTWPCVDAPPPSEAKRIEPVTVDFPNVGSRAAQAVGPALVMVDFDIPYPTAGVKATNYQGAGVVIDAERGLVLTDRDTVPVSLGDLVLTFAGQVRIPGELVFLHPVHNLAVLRYDPALLGNTEVRAVEFIDRDVLPGEDLVQVALDRSHQVVDHGTSVSRTMPLRMRASGTPRFRDSNVEGIELTDAMPSLGGVLTDKKGRVVAGWFSFLNQAENERTFYGLPTAFIAPMVNALRRGDTPEVRSLGIEIWPLALAEARDRGLAEDRAALLLAHDPTHRQVMEIERVSGGSPASDLLREGDLLLAVDGQPVTRMLEFADANAGPKSSLVVLRDGQEVTVEVPTRALPTLGVQRVLLWAGLTLHDPHYEVAHQYGRDMPGVYITWLWYGTPGSRYGLRPTRRITEVDGQPTPTIDALLAVVRGMKDRQAVRVRLASLDGKVVVRTLKLDQLYWPTQVLERKDGVWTRRTLDAP